MKIHEATEVLNVEEGRGSERVAVTDVAALGIHSFSFSFHNQIGIGCRRRRRSYSVMQLLIVIYLFLANENEVEKLVKVVNFWQKFSSFFIFHCQLCNPE